MDEDSAVRRPRPAGHPAAGPRPARARLGGRQRGRRARHDRCPRRPRGRARRARRHRRERPALPPVRRSRRRRAACSSTSTSPAPTPPSPAAASTRRGSRWAAGWRASLPRRGRPGDPGPGVRAPRPRSATPRRRGIPYGQGFVKNAYVGRTFIQPSPDPAPARHPAQAQPARARDPRQAARRRRRLDRARQHPARPDPDAPRGGRRRGARAHLGAAGEVAVLLRHRLRHPRRADRQRARRRGDPRQRRRRQPRLHLRGRHDRGDRAARGPALPGLLRRASTRSSCPTRALLGKHLLERAATVRSLTVRRGGRRRRWPALSSP